MERSRTLRFAVGTSLLATASLAASCNTEDTTIDDASPRAIDVVLPIGEEGSDDTLGETTSDVGPLPDVGSPNDPDDDIETPPPPPIVNPGIVQGVR